MSSPSDWNPEQYLRFADARARPSIDLVSRIKLDAPKTAVDIGCGPGNSAAMILARWPKVAITGIDSSPAMVERARAELPGHSWLVADAGRFEFPQTFDLVFSNATIQWVPGHERLISRLLGAAKPGGALAVQVPRFDRMPVHDALLSVSSRPEWAHRMAGIEGLFTYHPAGYYFDLLSPLSSSIDLWESEYFHVMDSAAATHADAD